MGNCVSSHQDFSEGHSRLDSKDGEDEEIYSRYQHYGPTEDLMSGLRRELGRSVEEQQQRLSTLEDSLAGGRLGEPLDVQEIWRLVHRDVEMEYLHDGQEASSVAVTTDSLRDQVAKEILSLRSQLERSQAALHVLQSRTLPPGRDHNFDSANNNLRGGSSPLVEALNLVDFAHVGHHPPVSVPRQVQGTISADNFLDHDDHGGYRDNTYQQGDSSSCPHLLDNPPISVTTTTQTERRSKSHGGGTKRGRAPHVSGSKYAVINSSTGSSTSGVDVSSSISSRSESLNTLRKTVHIVETAVDSLSSPDDPENPLIRHRTPSFKRAIERGPSGDSSTLSFETVEPVSTSSDLSPDRPDLPPSYVEHLALHCREPGRHSPRPGGHKSRHRKHTYLSPPSFHGNSRFVDNSHHSNSRDNIHGNSRSSVDNSDHIQGLGSDHTRSVKGSQSVKGSPSLSVKTAQTSLKSSQKSELTSSVDSCFVDDGYHDYSSDEVVNFADDSGLDSSGGAKTAEEGDSAHSRRLSTLVEESDQEMTEEFVRGRGSHRGTNPGHLDGLPSRFLSPTASPPPPQYKLPPAYRDATNRSGSPALNRLTLDLSRSQSPSSHQYQNRPRSPSPNRYRSNRIHPECPPSLQQQAPANQQQAPLTQQQAPPTQQQAQPTQQQPPPNQQQPPPTSALSGSQKAQLEFRGSCSGQVTPPAAAGVTMTTMIGNAGRHDSGSDVRSVATVTSEDGRKDQISSVGRARRKSLQDMKQQGLTLSTEMADGAESHKAESSPLAGPQKIVKSRRQGKGSASSGGTNPDQEMSASSGSTSSEDGCIIDDLPRSQSIDEGREQDEDDVFSGKSPTSGKPTSSDCATKSNLQETVTNGSVCDKRSPANKDNKTTPATLSSPARASTQPDPPSSPVGLVAPSSPGPGASASLAKVREENLAKKRSLSKQPIMPELSETPSEAHLVETSGSRDQSPARRGCVEKENVFPSLPDSYMTKLGLARGESGENVEQTPEQEVEDKFVSLSLAFKTDRLTLDKRVELHQRARDIAEQNIDREMDGIREALKLLGHCCTDAKSRDVYTKIQHHVDVLEHSASRMSSRAEVLGAVQQECRISLAIDVMLQHVDNLKKTLDKEHGELEDTRKLLQDNRHPGSHGASSEDYLQKRSMSMTAGIIGAKGARRRASVAVLQKTSSPLGPPRSTSTRTTDDLDPRPSPSSPPLTAPFSAAPAPFSAAPALFSRDHVSSTLRRTSAALATSTGSALRRASVAMGLRASPDPVRTSCTEPVRTSSPDPVRTTSPISPQKNVIPAQGNVSQRTRKTSSLLAPLVVVEESDHEHDKPHDGNSSDSNSSRVESLQTQLPKSTKTPAYEPLQNSLSKERTLSQKDQKQCQQNTTDNKHTPGQTPHTGEVSSKPTKPDRTDPTAGDPLSQPAPESPDKGLGMGDLEHLRSLAQDHSTFVDDQEDTADKTPFSPGPEDMFIERLLSRWPGWDQATVQLRYTAAAVLVVVAILTLAQSFWSPTQGVVSTRRQTQK